MDNEIDIEKILDFIENSPPPPLDYSKPIGVSYRFPIDGYLHTYEAVVLHRRLEKDVVTYLVRYGHFDISDTNDIWFKSDGQPVEEKYVGNHKVVNYDPELFDKIYSEYLKKL
jgi:hypothetical protein